MNNAKIIAQNHNVISFTLNGKKQYIVETVRETTNRKIVNMAIAAVNSREWSVVYNYLDKQHAQNSMPLDLEKTIERMTY